MKFVMPSSVFAPVPYEYNLLAKAAINDVKVGDRVLDVGTGCGVQAVMAATKSINVFAVDVNPFAVKCAQQNVLSNHLSSRVKVIKSNLFENVKGRFDLITFDPPFRWTEPRDYWEMCSADPCYGTMIHFFENVKEYLRDDGRVLVHFGTSGDIVFFRHLISKNGFRRRQVMKQSRKGWVYFVYKLTT
ncbi:MAG: methyltransferase [Methanomassiliicoccus sp.]|nr:methyltransferase [Methanomassiliicoccus sp.]